MTPQSDRLMRARCRLMIRQPWYGHVAMNMSWIASEMKWISDGQARTMGVRIVNGGEVQCIYYPPFVDSLTINELYVIIQHEIEHIVRCHCIRVGSRNQQAWNIAADMTVNGNSSNPRIGYKDTHTQKLIMPHADDIVWIPDSWPQDGTAEQYYDQLMADGDAADGDAADGDAADGDAADGDAADGDAADGDAADGDAADGDAADGDGDFGGAAIDDHSIWNQSDVSADEARQIAKDMVDQATEKCQGHAPGHLLEAIKNLNKPVVRWRELLRRYLGKHAGNYRYTYSRRNRRRQWFGSKGISHHVASDVTVIVDTSGSVGDKELSQFFAEIEAISHRSRVWVLQWDAAFQGYARYRRGDWKKLTINGRGGTDMAAPIEYLYENNLVPDVTVMLTDGFCNYADDKKIPFICVITTLDGTKPDWGHVIRMDIR